MILETRHLRLLAAIRAGATLTRAAEQLCVTQPAASRSLLELERRLGVELFARGARGMTPTPAGQRLLEAADRVLPELARAERAVAELRSWARGILRLTTECYTCYHWVPRILRAFREDFPGVDLRLVPKAKSRPLKALLAGEVDLAILHHHPDDARVKARKLFSDELVAVFAPDHPLAGRRSVRPSDFAGQHLVLHTDYATSQLAREYLGPAGVRPRRISEIQLTEAVLAVVNSGLGVTVMANWAVRPEVERGVLVTARLSPRGRFRTWYSAILAERASDPVLTTLVDRLRGEMLVGTASPLPPAAARRGA